MKYAWIIFCFAGCDSGSNAVQQPLDTSIADDTSAPISDGTVQPTTPSEVVQPEVVQPEVVEGDRCEGVPLTGRCSGDTLERCVVGTGSAETFVLRTPCVGDLTCASEGSGARCVPRYECVSGASECRGNNVAQCDGGTWQVSSCSNGCSASVGEATCRPNVVTERYGNTLTYEYRGINEGFTDWASAPSTAEAVGFLVLSFADNEVLDVTTTDISGYFELDVVPAHRIDGDDFLVVATIKLGTDDSLVYGVFDPGLSSGTHDVDRVLEANLPDAKSWFWSWDTATIASGAGVHLPLESGSAAAYAFDYLGFIYDYADEFFGARDHSSLAMWLGFGATWSCGACFTNVPRTVSGDELDNQIFIGADHNEAYWSGAVIAHELGHWLMSTYGVSPGEGGQHIFGVPSHPGLAWSEGFATWFSMVSRGEGFYYDKQDGTFFWIDMDSRSSSSGSAWYRPEAQYGLEQLIDENEVARTLLSITSDTSFRGMLGALSSPRMTVSPFLRGYLRRTWEGLDANGWPLPAWSTNESAPHLADYLDALVCGGVVSASEVDAQTEPWAHYPYPSQQPLCRSAKLPVQVSWLPNAAVVQWYVPLARDLELRFEPGTSTTVVPAGTPPGSLALPFPMRPGALGSLSPDALRVTTAGDDWHLSGRVERAPRAVTGPVRDGPHFVWRGRDYGPSIRVR